MVNAQHICSQAPIIERPPLSPCSLCPGGEEGATAAAAEGPFVCRGFCLLWLRALSVWARWSQRPWAVVAQKAAHVQGGHQHPPSAVAPLLGRTPRLPGGCTSRADGGGPYRPHRANPAARGPRELVRSLRPTRIGAGSPSAVFAPASCVSSCAGLARESTPSQLATPSKPPEEESRRREHARFGGVPVLRRRGLVEGAACGAARGAGRGGRGATAGWCGAGGAPH